MADPATLLRKLLYPFSTMNHDEDGRDRRQFNTGRALGTAFSWTVHGCPKHDGTEVPFNIFCKVSDPVPLQLVSAFSDHRPSTQEVVTSMGHDNQPANIDENHSAWHHCKMHCGLCVDEKRKSGKRWTQTWSAVPTMHTLRLHDSGPSHFLAQTHDNHQFSGEERRRGVAPSVKLGVFGSHYSLCAVVYWKGDGAHFVCQAYLPKEKCWVKYDDTRRGEAPTSREFDDVFGAGNEYIFLYVREDIMETAGCLVREAHECHRDAESTGNTGGTSGELKAPQTPASTQPGVGGL